MSTSSSATPSSLRTALDEAHERVHSYFETLRVNAATGRVDVMDERYVLVRAASLSVEFFDMVVNLYEDHTDANATAIAHGLLFDLSHAIGRADAVAFHQRFGDDSLEKRLAIGPVHFAHTGWATVELLPDSRVTFGDEFRLIYNHHNSFEADAWLEAKGGAQFPVCTMSAGYSSGWLSESCEIDVVATEITCRARGDENCCFVMAHPDRIEEEVADYLEREPEVAEHVSHYNVPGFFERKRIEAALREQKEQYRGVFEASADGLLVIAPDDEIVAANQAAAELFGRTSEELTGADSRDVLGPDFNNSALLGSLTDGQDDYVSRSRLQTPGGETLEAEIRATSFRFRKKPHLLVSVRDVTEEERMREQLYRADRLASLGQLAAGVAHEINNPLSFIISNLEVSLWELDKADQLDPEELRMAIEKAKKGAERVKRTVRDLTTFSHGGMDDSVEPVDVHVVLDLTIQMAMRTVLEQGGSVEKHYGSDVPKALANESRLSQVFLNLLVNAAQALDPSGDGEQQVRVETWVDDQDRIVVEITDTGRGIPEEIRGKIFDPFFTTKAVGEGTGIGLSVCHEIVQAIGGELDMQSEVGEGTTFTLTLPSLKQLQ
ncbi:MAG: ATP-binding protein [Myxococcota bacterium]